MSGIVSQLSRDVINACNSMAETGLVAGTWGNASARSEDGIVLITPSGIPYHNLNVTDMVAMDLSGSVVEGHMRPSTEYSLHLEIYKNRPDVRAIVHTHSIYACALAANRTELPVLLEEQAQLAGGKVPVAGYAPAGTEDLAGKAVEALGGQGAVLLANHGLAGVGKDVQEALLVCRIVEKACRVYIAAKSIGEPVALGEEEVDVLRSSFLTNYGQ